MSALQELLARAVELEEKAERAYTRDGIGRFAAEGEKDKGEEARGSKDAEDYDVRDLDDVRQLVRNWDKIPASARAALKRKLEAVVERESTEEHGHERLLALIGGLGDGDGKREAGEGAGRALAGKPGAAREWLREHGHGDLTRGKKADEDVVNPEVLLQQVTEFKELLEAIAASSEPGVDPVVDAEAAAEEAAAEEPAVEQAAPEEDFTGVDFTVDEDDLDDQGEPLEADEPKGYDFTDDEDEHEVKGFGACPECGSTNRDEYADGTARCEDCGAELAETKGYDFVDDEEPEPVLEEKTLADATERLSELEVLMHRRAALSL